MASEGEAQVAITLQVAEGDEPLEKREEQALLSLIKGNIN
jgi:hypothetical protein